VRQDIVVGSLFFGGELRSVARPAANKLSVPACKADTTESVTAIFTNSKAVFFRSFFRSSVVF
jgi:hypothetical protein